MALRTTFEAVTEAARRPLKDSWTSLDPDQTRRAIAALVVVALLYPIVICALFYPTPYVDLREQINWGLVFPLSTWKHPPLQSWITGIAALTGLRDAWFYIAVAQILNGIAFYYLIRIGREFVGLYLIAPFLMIGVGHFYFSAWQPTTALNADQIQAPIWAAAIFYALQAARDDRWRDWLILGALFSLSVLAKYFAAVLAVTLLVAAAATPEYRHIFRSRKFYTSIALAIALAAPFVALSIQEGHTIDHGARFFGPRASILERLDALAAFLSPFALLLMPLIVVAVAGRKDGGLDLVRPPRTPPVRFLLAAGIAFVAIMIAMILAGGLLFRARFSYPYLPIAALLVLIVVRLESPALMGLLRTMAVIWAVLIAGTVGYALFVLRGDMRDPGPEAARLMRQEWTAAHACGPANILGEKLEAYAVALYYGTSWKPVIGLSEHDYVYARWTDRDRIRRSGAIIVARSKDMARNLFLADFPERTAPRHLALAYRRTFLDARHDYYYVFIPPQAC